MVADGFPLPKDWIAERHPITIGFNFVARTKLARRVIIDLPKRERNRSVAYSGQRAAVGSSLISS